MGKMKLALIGCGYLNDIIANALKDGFLPEYELVGVMGKYPEEAQDFAKRHNCKACNNILELMDLKPEYTVEAASPQAVKDYAETILEKGSNLVMLSIGAFADVDFYEEIKKVALKNNRKVYIPSGAVGGFDVLRAATLMGPVSAKITAKKAPGSLRSTPLYKAGLDNITEPERVFTGNTKEAIKILPFQVNVAVATSLASAGPEKTIMDIYALPGFIGDEYKIEIQGEEVRTDLNIYSKTSSVAAWSVVAVLQNITSPIVF